MGGGQYLPRHAAQLTAWGGGAHAIRRRSLAIGRIWECGALVGRGCERGSCTSKHKSLALCRGSAVWPAVIHVTQHMRGEHSAQTILVSSCKWAAFQCAALLTGDAA